MTTSQNNILSSKGFRAFISVPISENETKYADSAVEVLDQFFRQQPSDKKRQFGFTIYIEPVVDYSRQCDYTTDTGWNMQCHIDYNTFTKAKPGEKTALLLTACQLMIQARVTAPGYAKRSIDYAAIGQDLQLYLQNELLYYNDHSFFIRPTTNTRFSVSALTNSDSFRKKLNANLKHLEAYLTNQFVQQQFGKGLVTVQFHFAVFDFSDPATSAFDKDEKQINYNARTQFLDFSGSIDYNVIAKLNKDDFFNYIKGILKETLEFIGNSQKVSKLFNFEAYKQAFSDHLDKYIP